MASRRWHIDRATMARSLPSQGSTMTEDNGSLENNFFVSVLFGLGAIPRNTQGFLLALPSGITPGSAWGRVSIWHLRN